MLEKATQMGLKPDEYEKIVQLMGRTPNLCELGIFSAMWSEHCSYKSTKIWLRQLHTTGRQVICGPGENAGVVDIGDDDAIIFKIESHNHPSFIEPFQGAATGVGGIMRDIFTMGAKPIANLNALRFGDLNHPKTPYLLKNVIAGIAHYGNCMGIPTIAGELECDESYNNNILVNAMTIGIAKKDKIYYAKASGVGNKVMYVGAKTGRDGIHGATMSSAEFDDNSAKNRPAVQVGDPFMERLLMLACLELMQTSAIIAIQDMGAAGLTSSSVEMADKGGVGIRLDLDRVPTRETGMNEYELMLSESQERMLIIIAPGKEKLAEDIFKKYDLSCSTIGEITASKKLELYMHGQMVGDIGVDILVNNAPKYNRPFDTTPPKPAYSPEKMPFKLAINPYLKKYSANSALEKFGHHLRQYDSLVGGNLIAGALAGKPAGAAVVKCPDSNKALAVSVDCIARYNIVDPYLGTLHAICESYRNLVCVHAKPLAITNNLNFGNPEKPHIMGQIVGAVQAMQNACAILDYPVISGNVSLYNETNGVAIRPTPVIGGVGLINHYQETIGMRYEEEEYIILVGQNRCELGASRYAELHGFRHQFAPPQCDPQLELKNAQFVLNLMDNGAVTACHDVSDGGLLINLIEMARASNMGFAINGGADANNLNYWFSESAHCYIITIKNLGDIINTANQANVAVECLGRTGGNECFIGKTKLSAKL